MKTLILASALLLAQTFSAEASTLHASKWGKANPTALANVLEVLKYEASYYSFATDDGTCGGEISPPALVEHREATDSNGLVTHQLVMNFELSVARNYCATVGHTQCEAVVTLTGNDEPVLNGFDCAE